MRRDPDTLVAGVHQVTMAELGPAHVDMSLSHIGDHHADMANGNFQHADLLHADEPWIEVPRAGIAKFAPAGRDDLRCSKTPVRFGSCRGPARVRPQFLPGRWGRPSSVVTIPTASGFTE